MQEAQAFAGPLNMTIRSCEEPWLRSRLIGTRFLPSTEVHRRVPLDDKERHWTAFSELEWQEYVSAKPTQKRSIELMQRNEMSRKQNGSQDAARSFGSLMC